MSFSIEIKGLRELQAKFNQLPVELQTRVKAQVERGVQVFVDLAKKDAPVDVGFLRAGISYAFVIADKTHTTFEVVSNAEYSAYQEFGTITFAPEGVALAAEQSEQPTLPAYAATFKGKGLRKTGGIFPHPFFFKQLPFAKQTIEEGIAAELKTL